jgi:serine/threonine protein kinase/tetratricopeptide (TPR) repeat protein
MNARVKELFHELADLPPDARTRYFAENQVDDDTRREVQELLSFDSGASVFLVRDISIAASQSLPQLDPKGWRCGPYQLLNVIGRGGMGTVYLAERVDGEVTQRLAVKLLPAGAGDFRRERFLQERQILASLAHPNIARMLDAGHLEDGQPYLVMEYVEGKPIDVFAAGRALREKIAMFLKVCSAVGYLHRNLVVHRDIKPSNILVTAEGEPKLLDFGIAKLLDVASDVTVTITSMRMLTPDYASPEQVTGGRVTTATDVYSLGALLYYLLTGKRVHEFEGEERSPDSIARAVTEREPARPSTWSPALKGDLDHILLKALRKDPQERYATVEQFAEDLHAFLESRTVRARSGNRWYRMRKFIRRYWLPVSAAAAVIASLAAGLYVANRERVIAERRFQDVRELSNRLFDIDAQVRELPGSTKARQLIVNTSLEYLQRLRADVRNDPDLALEVGSAYMEVAGAEGISSGPNLGQLDNADRDVGVADQLVQAVLKSRPSSRAAMLKAAEVASYRMEIAWERSHEDEALAFARKSAQWLDQFQASARDKAQASTILRTYGAVAHQYMMEQEFDEALQLTRRGEDLARTFGRNQDRANFLDTAALALSYQGSLDEALKSIRESVDLQESGAAELGYREAMNLVTSLAREGWILGDPDSISLGQSGEAVKVLERAFQIADSFVHKDQKDETPRSRLFLAGGSLADILWRSDPQRGLDVYDHLLRDMDEVDSKFLRLREVDVLAGSSYALRRLGRTAEARQRLDWAFAILRDLKLYPAEKIEPGAEADVALSALADHEAETGNWVRGIEICRGLLERAREMKPETSLVGAVNLSEIYGSLAAIYRRGGKAELASTVQAKRSELWQHWVGKLPNNPFVLRQMRAAASP